jgi:DNA invertase Pin-like site-specific DNA recombinase
VAEIRAAKDVYRPVDVARHYDINPSTVYRIWREEVHAGVAPGDVPTIKGKPRVQDLLEDIEILLRRGLKPVEIAERLEISKSTVYQYRGIFI